MSLTCLGAARLYARPGGAEGDPGRAGRWMTSSPVQHAAAVVIAAAATGHNTVEQLPAAAQALQPSTPAPESLSRASNGILMSNATTMCTRHELAAWLYCQCECDYGLCSKIDFQVPLQQLLLKKSALLPQICCRIDFAWSFDTHCAGHRRKD